MTDKPFAIAEHVPSATGRRLFTKALGKARNEGKSEAVSFARAWLALWKAGFREGADKQWRKTAQKLVVAKRAPSNVVQLPERLADVARS